MCGDLGILAALALPLPPAWPGPEALPTHSSRAMAGTDRCGASPDAASRTHPLGRLPRDEPCVGWQVQLSEILFHQPLRRHPGDLPKGVRCPGDQLSQLET